MAVQQGKPLHIRSSNRPLRQRQLFNLISQLCEARRAHFAPGRCRLIVDSRLAWAVEPIDGERAWLYLPETARVRKVAGCLVLTAD